MFLRETTPSPGQVRRELKKGAVAGGTRRQIWQTSFFDRNRWYQCHLDKLNKRVVRGSRGAVKRFAASPVTSARMQMYGLATSAASRAMKQKLRSVSSQSAGREPRAQQTMRLRSTQDNFRPRRAAVSCYEREKFVNCWRPSSRTPSNRSLF